jgi:phosphoglucosamine mutase
MNDSQPRLFGTDGVRGMANREITARLALRLGEAAARVLTRNSIGSRKRAIVGRDTRVSGEFLARAVAAGLASAGVDVIDIGVLPTPGIAYLTNRLGVDLGVVISASHNPMPDNGIKFFGSDGFKLDDAVEDEIEQHVELAWERPIGEDVGRISVDTSVPSQLYVEHLLSAVAADSQNKPLKNLTIAVDTANGAGSAVALEALRQAGADVVAINASPDGYNINEKCGSTHPEQLQAIVVASGADFGVALDGDADRCIAVDERGNIVDGDKILMILALHYLKLGKLAHNQLAITVMSNLGLKLALEKAGITAEVTAVGDRYVLEKMRELGLNLGGEQSGHIINLDYSTTGDGTLAALLLAQTFAEQLQTNPQLKMSEMAAVFQILPQILVNVRDVDKNKMSSSTVLAQEIAQVEAELGDTGRVLLRPSGTEPIVRVMVEAATQEEAVKHANYLATVVKQELSYEIDAKGTS